MKELDRYEFGEYGEAWPRTDGEWCRSDDAIAALEAAEAREKVLLERLSLYREWEKKVSRGSAKRFLETEQLRARVAELEGMVPKWRKIDEDTPLDVDLREQYADLPVAVFNLCYSQAYDRGHSSGYDEVANYMIDIVYFAQKIIEASK
jgi:hypothetical protein